MTTVRIDRYQKQTCVEIYWQSDSVLILIHDLIKLLTNLKKYATIGFHIKQQFTNGHGIDAWNSTIIVNLTGMKRKIEKM